MTYKLRCLSNLWYASFLEERVKLYILSYFFGDRNRCKTLGCINRMRKRGLICYSEIISSFWVVHWLGEVEEHCWELLSSDSWVCLFDVILGHLEEEVFGIWTLMLEVWTLGREVSLLEAVVAKHLFCVFFPQHLAICGKSWQDSRKKAKIRYCTLRKYLICLIFHKFHVS